MSKMILPLFLIPDKMESVAIRKPKNGQLLGACAVNSIPRLCRNCKCGNKNNKYSLLKERTPRPKWPNFESSPDY